MSSSVSMHVNSRKRNGDNVKENELALSEDMPQWIVVDDSHTISQSWIEEKTRIQNIQYVTVEDISNQNRKGVSVKDGATIRVTLTLNTSTTTPNVVINDSKKKNENGCSNGEEQENSSSTLSLIIKQATGDKALVTSRKLGLAREALFYHQLITQEPYDIPAEDEGYTNNINNTIISMPKIYYSYGNFITGQKCIIMQDLGDESVDSGVLFGSGNPNNWPQNRPNLAQLASKAGNPPPRSKHVAMITFREIAKVHAMFWRRQDLLSINGARTTVYRVYK